MTVSIIIAVKTLSKHLEECVAKCLELDFSDFEILILPDFDIGSIDKLLATRYSLLAKRGTVPIRIIPTGPVSPAQKRDIALNYAKGQILAFIDDDAYPTKDWLKNAMENFKDSDVAAVGGPAITPQEDSLRQKASGAIYSSYLVSGPYVYRYVPGKRKEAYDLPTCNFLVHKSIMQELGGFDTKFWPGEDTKLTLDITKKLGKKIIYDPNVLVYHHRRPLFLSHLRQVASYASHRGYFVKKYPETSLRLPYFIPSFLLTGIILGLILSLIFPFLRVIYLFLLITYLVLVFLFSLSKNLKLVFLVFSGIIPTHLTYGINFLKGFLSPRLKEEK